MKHNLLILAGCPLIAGMAVVAVFVYVDRKVAQAAGWLT